MELSEKTPRKPQRPNALVHRAILRFLASGEVRTYTEIRKKVRKPAGQVSVALYRLVDSGDIVRVDRGLYRLAEKEGK